MADPCPASPQTPTPVSNRHTHRHPSPSTPFDAIELAEILEYFIERFDILAEHDLRTLLFAARSPYGFHELRADLTRLINHLHTSSMNP